MSFVERIPAIRVTTPDGLGGTDDYLGYLMTVGPGGEIGFPPPVWPAYIGVSQLVEENSPLFVKELLGLSERQKILWIAGELRLADLGIEVGGGQTMLWLGRRTGKAVRSGASPDPSGWRLRRPRLIGVPVPKSTLSQTVELPYEDRIAVEARQAALNNYLDTQLGTTRTEEVVVFEAGENSSVEG